MEFVLDVSKWRSGGTGSEKLGRGDTLLLNRQGYQCCVGQFLEQCGVPREHLKTVGTACSALRSTNKPPRSTRFFAREVGLWFDDTRIAVKLYGINDDSESPKNDIFGDLIVRTVRQKIKAIREILAKRGHTLRVVNLVETLSK
jgi:hypothetical protein